MTSKRRFRNTPDANHAINEETATSTSRKIAPDTIKQYHGFVKTLRRSLQYSSPYAELQTVISPIDLVNHLYIRAKKGELRSKTFVNYRSALLYWTSTIFPCPEVDSARLRLKMEFPKTGFKSSKPGGNKATLYSTRSSRKRTFRRTDFERLTRELERRITKAQFDERMTPRANELLVWLRAGLASGLRPIEWETAEWINRADGELLVQTAKIKTGGFALPSLQHLPAPKPTTRIVTIDAEERVWVDQQL